MRTEEQAVLIQSLLEIVTKSGNEWQMLFNLNRCRVLRVGKSDTKHQYSMGDIPLDNVLNAVHTYRNDEMNVYIELLSSG